MSRLAFLAGWAAHIRKAWNAEPMSAVNDRGWYNIIRESYAGAWQQAVTVDSQRDLLAFSGVFAPLTLIASDMSKCGLRLIKTGVNDISTEVKTDSPYLAVLRRPNHYQNRIKFVEQWVVSKLLYGNTYVLKERDKDGVVVGLYILDASRVVPLVAVSGDVYYQLNADNLSSIADSITVPASEIIHDMMVSLWHPLVGVSPIYAAGLSATQGRKIQNNSSKFFDNMSRPSGMLTAPATIADETATRLKREFEANFSGANIGRLAVLGDGLKYEAMTIPAQQAQMIEQLQWTARDVAACFHMPLFKVGGPAPGSNIEALNLQYYSDCLQSLIEQFELCLSEGLSLPEDHSVEFNIQNLMRMDTTAQVSVLNLAVGGGWMSPNEARRERNMPPVEGGDSPVMQQQNYSLAALAKRDAREDPFAPSGGGAAGGAVPGPLPPKKPEAVVPAATEEIEAETEEKVMAEVTALFTVLTKGLDHV